MLRWPPHNLLLATVPALLVAGVACASAPPAVVDGGGRPDEASLLERMTLDQPVQLEFWGRQGTPEAEALQQKIVAQFGQQFPAIQLQVRTFPDYQALYAETLGAIQRNEAPDIATVYDTWAAEYYEAGALVPLDAYVASPKWGMTDAELADFFPNFLDATQFEEYAERRLTFPFHKSVYVLYTNLSLLSTAGLAQPAERWTELDAHCAQVKARAKKACMAFPTDPSLFTAMLYGQGITPVDGVGHSKLDDRGVLDALKALERLRGVRALANVEPHQARSDFLRGEALYHVDSSGLLPSVSEAFSKAGRSWRVSLVPQLEGATGRATTLVGSNVAILKRKGVELTQGEVRRRLAAWLFVEFFTSAEITSIWGFDSSNGYFPLRRSVLDVPANLQKLQAQPQFAEAFRIAQEAGKTEPNVRGWQEVRQIIGDSLAELGAGRLDAQRAQQRMMKRANQVLE